MPNTQVTTPLRSGERLQERQNQAVIDGYEDLER
jgi:hypothetical protein